MSVGAILTLGFGVFGSVNLLPTIGYGTSATPPTPTVEIDTHDAAEEFKRQDEEIRRQRQELREQLLSAVERVTGKPPPLDASNKQLAQIAKKSESFDYRAILLEIERLDERAIAERRTRADRARAIADRRRAEEEMVLMIVLGRR